MTTETTAFLKLLSEITTETLKIEKELRANYNQREWVAQHGNATIKDVASMMARR